MKKNKKEPQSIDKYYIKVMALEKQKNKTKVRVREFKDIPKSPEITE